MNTLRSLLKINYCNEIKLVYFIILTHTDIYYIGGCKFEAQPRQNATRKAKLAETENKQNAVKSIQILSIVTFSRRKREKKSNKFAREFH